MKKLFYFFCCLFLVASINLNAIRDVTGSLLTLPYSAASTVVDGGYYQDPYWNWNNDHFFKVFAYNNTFPSGNNYIQLSLWQDEGNSNSYYYADDKILPAPGDYRVTSYSANSKVSYGNIYWGTAFDGSEMGMFVAGSLRNGVAYSYSSYRCHHTGYEESSYGSPNGDDVHIEVGRGGKIFIVVKDHDSQVITDVIGSPADIKTTLTSAVYCVDETNPVKEIVILAKNASGEQAYLKFYTTSLDPQIGVPAGDYIVGETVNGLVSDNEGTNVPIIESGKIRVSKSGSNISITTLETLKGEGYEEATITMSNVAITKKTPVSVNIPTANLTSLNLATYINDGGRAGVVQWYGTASDDKRYCVTVKTGVAVDFVNGGGSIYHDNTYQGADKLNKTLTFSTPSYVNVEMHRGTPTMDSWLTASNGDVYHITAKKASTNTYPTDSHTPNTAYSASFSSSQWSEEHELGHVVVHADNGSKNAHIDLFTDVTADGLIPSGTYTFNDQECRGIASAHASQGLDENGDLDYTFMANSSYNNIWYVRSGRVEVVNVNEQYYITVSATSSRSKSVSATIGTAPKTIRVDTVGGEHGTAQIQFTATNWNNKVLTYASGKDHKFFQGQSIQLQATPALHYHVTWSDNLGTNNNVNVTVPNSNKTYTATFSGDQYTITYKDKDNAEFTGKQTNAPTTHTYGTATTLKIPTKVGYDFGGWFTASNCESGAVGNATAASLGATDYTAKITLYAKWELKTYTAANNIDKNGGASNGQYTATYNATTITINTAPDAETGYKLEGLYQEPACTNKIADASGNLQPSTAYTDANRKWKQDGNVTLYAKWSAVTYNLTYEGLEGATNSSNPTSYNIESETITLADPGTRDGYIFAGWKDESDNAITEIAHGSTGNRTLTATWTKATTLDLYDDRDATYYNNIKDLIGKTYDVTLNRTFKPERWSTICLPFDYNQAQMEGHPLKGNINEYLYSEGNATSGGSGLTLYFKSAKSIEAGKPYLVYNTTGDDIVNPTFAGVTIDTDLDTEDADIDDILSKFSYKQSGSISLVGTFRKIKLPEQNHAYMGLMYDETAGKTKIYYPGTNAHVPAYRAFFHIDSGSSVQQRVRIVVDGVDMGEMLIDNGEIVPTTENLSADRAPRKYIRNGVLVIERNGVTYDAQGKRL